MEGGYLTEIPSYLKQLARIIARSFFQIEDFLLIDVLVRNVCMKEKQIEELLKFDAKLLRARLTTLKNEKFVQTRLRMETGADGKAQKVNYYFINYKSLVNVIKYKLDHMRKKMETQERDATNRASFKCTNSNCAKTFTDLEAGELFDVVTGSFYCTFCRQNVEEDESAAVPKDSRLLLAKFNDQLEIVFDLLRKAENIKLAPELLDPEPLKTEHSENRDSGRNERGGMWSGEATRSTGANDQTRIDITIGDDAAHKPREEKKERPVWMMESTIGGGYNDNSRATTSSSTISSSEAASQDKHAQKEDIMSVLLAFEKKEGAQKPVIPETNDSDSDEDPDTMNVPDHLRNSTAAAISSMDVDDDVDEMEEDDEDEESVPTVAVGHERIPITQVTPDLIAKMTPTEKDNYVQQYQDFFQE